MVQTLTPLVDLSLYGSSENYHSATRPAFSTSLSFPESWITPPSRHSLAQERIQRLGLEASDLDSPSVDKPRKSESGPLQAFREPKAAHAGHADQSHPTLIRQFAARQRLSAQVERALDPAMSLLKSQSGPYLFGGRPSLADCYLLALSALALNLDLPAPFLASEIKRSYNRLESYVAEGIKNAFGRAVSPVDALAKAPMVSDEEDHEAAVGDGYEKMDVGSGKTELPWRRLKIKSMTEMVGSYAGRAFAAAKSTLVEA
ncbi:MAG: hypothetical protein LQ340_004645 [Diploschistes diacapsis]|nr:MAG: hypothetical protein LQ340_004645 [Diploschistes diacapsis]